MKSSIQQLALGILPLLVGILYNYAMVFLPFPIFFMNLVFVAFWLFLCYRFSDPSQPVLPQVVRICLFGTVMLALVLYQELVQGSYWLNPIGFLSQFYFLPSMSLFGAVIAPFLDIIRAFPFYIASYIGMCLACLGTCLLKARKKPAA